MPGYHGVGKSDVVVIRDDSIDKRFIDKFKLTEGYKNILNDLNNGAEFNFTIDNKKLLAYKNNGTAYVKNLETNAIKEYSEEEELQKLCQVIITADSWSKNTNRSKGSDNILSDKNIAANPKMSDKKESLEKDQNSDNSLIKDFEKWKADKEAKKKSERQTIRLTKEQSRKWDPKIVRQLIDECVELSDDDKGPVIKMSDKNKKCQTNQNNFYKRAFLHLVSVFLEIKDSSILKSEKNLQLYIDFINRHNPGEIIDNAIQKLIEDGELEIE